MTGWDLGRCASRIVCRGRIGEIFELIDTLFIT